MTLIHPSCPSTESTNMLRAVSRRSTLATLLLTSILAAPSRAGDTVPIQAQGSLTVTGESIDPATGNLIDSVVLEGEVSDLGHVTGTRTQITYFPDYAHATLTTTQVAANGYELFVTYEGDFIDADGDSVGTFQITGGTGRFAGASGSGTFASFSFGAQVFEQGVITTVGGD
jgi:hypothetical protein